MGASPSPGDGEPYLQKFAELTPVVVNVFDLEVQRDVYVSSDVHRLLGYAPDEITRLQDVLSTLWHPDDVHLAHQHLARSKLAADGEITELEYRVRHRDGTWRWLYSRTTPFARSEDGAVRQIVTATVDVTQHKLAEAALRDAREELERRAVAAAEEAQQRAREADESRSVLDAILEYAPEGITVTGGPPDFPIVANSRHAERLLGQSPAAMLNIAAGANAETYGLWMADGVTRPRVEQLPLFRASHYGDVIENEELIVERPDGQRIHTLSNVAPIRNATGEIIGAIICWRDITERKRTQEALHEAQAELAHVARLAAIGELSASLAHELNQPLTAIAVNAAACVRWLNGAIPDIDEARAAAQRIARDAERGGEIIQHTRRLAGKSSLEKSVFDISDAIREVLVFAAAEVRSHGIVVRQALDEDLPPVSGSRVQIQQVVLNLVLNGIEAMTSVSDRARQLAITATRAEEEGGIVVLVQDTGTGIGFAEDDPARLFAAFYTTKPGGLGLGLSISQSIVQDHGGRLWAATNRQCGATFAFTLPASASATKSAKDAKKI